MRCPDLGPMIRIQVKVASCEKLGLVVLVVDPIFQPFEVRKSGERKSRKSVLTFFSFLITLFFYNFCLT